jgi:CelD/BcsL family acetyltransferase involved in cellulose biosynthesis
MGIARINNQPVAAQIWLVHQRKASIYKLAYDKLYAGCSIGSILTASLFEHVIDVDQVEEVDFLNGDESYKQDWMSHRREYWGIIAYNRHTWKGQISCLLQKLGRRIKKLKQGS